MNLSYFQTLGLYEASQNFFTNNLQIPMQKGGKNPLKPQIELEKRYKPQKAHYHNINDIYTIGMVSQEAFEKSGLNVVFDKATDKYKDGMLVFAVDFKPNFTPKRQELADLTRDFNVLYNNFPVVMIARYGDYISLSTTERMDYKHTGRGGEKVGKVINIKDISITQTHRGHLEILREMMVGKDTKTYQGLYDQWKKVFDTKVLGKKFYSEIANWYFWASKHVQFPQIRPEKDKIENERYQEESVIRLLTRALFCWFLKEKGFIKPETFDRLYLQKILPAFVPEVQKDDVGLFSKKSKNADDSTYYKAILQNLFFATLSVQIEERQHIKNDYKASPDYGNQYVYRYADLLGDATVLNELFATVPFLNGGLFECLDEVPTDTNGIAQEIRLDGFSSVEKNKKGEKKQAYVPDFLFFGKDTIDLSKEYDEKKKKNVEVRGLFNIFNDYKFTLEENTPIEQEVALDPELLGQIFENLLAFYNPETSTTARKATGSFYTPREIVDYMVEESLLTHLRQHFPAIDSMEQLAGLPKENVIRQLLNIKIFDPSCGSGAYPMGVLHRMVDIFRMIDPENKVFLEVIKGEAMAEMKESIAKYKADKEILSKLSDAEIAQKAKDDIDRKIAEIQDNFEKSNKTDDYARKLYIIQHCIYGADIQNIAVQISKLRCFLSLVIEQKIDNPKDFGLIKPLPNLETKFVCANTLLKLEKPPSQTDMFNQQANLQAEAFRTNRDKHFSIQNVQEKLSVKTKDFLLRTQIANALQNDKNITSQTAKQLIEYDIFSQNAKANWFDLEWMFGIKDGFDIVIGNPPYIQIQKMRDKQPDLEKQKFETYERTGDIYCLFYEKGIQLLKKNGILAYITSNKWMRAGYGEKMRNYFIKNTNPLHLIDFGGVQVFESATVDTNILITQKTANRNELKGCTISKTDHNRSLNLSVYFQQNAQKIFSQQGWNIMPDIAQRIKEKIERIGTPLKEWDISIYRGILTGYNDAFIIDKAKRDELIEKSLQLNPATDIHRIIRPILRGRDIKRYSYEFAELYLIGIQCGWTDKNKGNQEAEDFFKAFYPAIYEHLLGYGNKETKGKGLYNRDDKGDYWWELRSCVYWEDFEKEKIIYPGIMRIAKSNQNNFPRFALDDKEHFFFCNDCYFIIGSNLNYLWLLLNSTLLGYLFRYYIYSFDETGFKIFTDYFQNIPLPLPNEERLKKAHKFIDKQFDNNLVNKWVYEMIGLTKDEIKEIDIYISNIVNKT